VTVCFVDIGGMELILLTSFHKVEKKVLKQWWSTIPPIWTKQTTPLTSNHRKKHTVYGVGNPGPGLGQANQAAIFNYFFLFSSLFITYLFFILSIQTTQ
jgi:hypothetical protein